MNIGKRIADLIDESDITQKDLSKILNVAPSTINGYITKGREPDIDTLVKLANYFNVSIDYLVNRNGLRSTSPNERILSDSENDLIQVYRNLTGFQQEFFIQQGKLLNRLNSKYNDIP